jgi:hypothetical protein
MKVWDINQNRETKSVKAFKGPLSSLSFNDNGSMVACASSSHNDNYSISLQSTSRKGTGINKTLLEGHKDVIN